MCRSKDSAVHNQNKLFFVLPPGVQSPKVYHPVKDFFFFFLLLLGGRKKSEKLLKQEQQTGV